MQHHKHGQYLRVDKSTMNIALVTSFCLLHKNIAEFTLPLLSAMCNRHKIAFFQESDEMFAKDKFLVKLSNIGHIIGENKYDWVFWCDIDCIPRNAIYDVRGFLWRAAQDDKHFVTAPSIGALFAIRNSEIGKKIFDYLETTKLYENNVNTPKQLDEIEIFKSMERMFQTSCRLNDEFQTSRIYADNHCWTFHPYVAADGRWPISCEEKLDLLKSGKDVIQWS